MLESDREDFARSNWWCSDFFGGREEGEESRPKSDNGAESKDRDSSLGVGGGGGVEIGAQPRWRGGTFGLLNMCGRARNGGVRV